MRRTTRWAVAALAVLGWTTVATAQTVGDLDADADQVFLRKDCSGYDNCVVDDLNGLNAWIWNTRDPSAASPLIVDIGPGDFSGSIDCTQGVEEDKGHTTFRGAGRDHSRIVADSKYRGLFPPKIAVYVLLCQDLGFQDLALVQAGTGAAAYFVGGTTSSWSDVDLDGKIGWYEVCNSLGTPADPADGEHFFWGVKIEATDIGYYADCDRGWLYGSDVLARGGTGVVVGRRGDVRLFGSTVRVTTEGVANPPVEIVGVSVGPGLVFGVGSGYGEFHMHGGIISLDATSSPDTSTTGLVVQTYGEPEGDALGHVIDTAFALRPGSNGGVTRVAGDGVIRSPFLWGSGSEPPVDELGSISGYDLFVENDCDANGCDGTGSDPHLMLYKADCPNSPWFDVARDACRD